MKGTEHDFSGSSDDWEQRVFDNASHFNLDCFHDKGRHKSSVETFPEALTQAAIAGDHPDMPNPRVLIYAVTLQGRFIAIPEKKWPAYLERWNAAHPTRKKT